MEGRRSLRPAAPSPRRSLTDDAPARSQAWPLPLDRPGGKRRWTRAVVLRRRCSAGQPGPSRPMAASSPACSSAIEEIGSIYQLQRVHRECRRAFALDALCRGRRRRAGGTTGRDARRRGAGPAVAHRRARAHCRHRRPGRRPSRPVATAWTRRPPWLGAASRSSAAPPRAKSCSTSPWCCWRAALPRRRSGRSRCSIRRACCGTGCTARPSSRASACGLRRSTARK